MLEKYKTIYKGAQTEIIEKKSRFITTVRLVQSEAEAVAFIEAMKKKYWNASHNCSAYAIGEGRAIVRCSDDGEPSGTAGRPMLDVLLGADLYNTAVVVTRYFGGTLLGTGGLVRAYSKAVQAGIDASIVIEKVYGVMLAIDTDYNGIGKIQYLMGQRKIPIMDSIYTDQVKIKVLLPKQQVPELKAEITENTNGKAILNEEEELYFAVLDGQVLTGDALVAQTEVSDY